MTAGKIEGTTRRSVVTGMAATGLLAVRDGSALAAQTSWVRSDVATPAGQSMLTQYAAAVAAMKEAAINNPPQPHSWTFQAYIHGVPKNPADPVNSPGLYNGSPELIARIDQIYGTPASGSPQAAWKQAALACWGTCPHFSPWFVSWHRWYVWYFESICRRMSKSDAFALPYWNYASNQDGSLQLPATFQQTTSPLFESVRGLGFANPNGTGSQNVPMNQNGYMPFAQTDYNPAVSAKPLFPSDDTFVLPPAPEYFALGLAGRLEIQPHDNVHDNVGGLMSNVPVAAGDPVFFVHHCQIDRLWASWQALPGISYNWGNSATQPSKTTWGNRKFAFVDAEGKLVHVTSEGQLSTKALHYTYDHLVVPPPQVASAAQGRRMRTTAAAHIINVAMQANGVTVGSQGARLTLTPTQPPATNSVRGAASPAPTTLELLDVKLLARPPAPLYVFLNLPEGTTPQLGDNYEVGPLSFFNWDTGTGGPMVNMGASGASGHTVTSTGSFRFNVADLLSRQRAANVWSGGPVTVTVTTLGADTSTGRNYVSIGHVELVP